jgi:hypothetical protein
LDPHSAATKLPTTIESRDVAAFKRELPVVVNRWPRAAALIAAVLLHLNWQAGVTLAVARCKAMREALTEAVVKRRAAAAARKAEIDKELAEMATHEATSAGIEALL